MTATVTRPDPRTWASPNYHKQWRLDRLQGRARTVDPVPARTHIAQLVARGVTIRSIAEQAGCSPSSVHRLLADEYPKIRATTAARFLAVTFDGILNRDRSRGFVPAVGARRRIQALMTLGWRHEDITARLIAHGCRIASAVILHHAGQMIERRTADAVRAVYDDLWATAGPSDASRGRARRAGYAPPLAWDDDTIDDPAARPAGVEGGMQSRRARLVEDVTELVAQGATVPSAAERLGKDRRNLERTLRRAGRADLWAALVDPDGARSRVVSA